MVCIDTNFIIDIIRQRPQAIAKLRDLASRNAFITTTAITVAELYHGVYKRNTIRARQEVEDVLRRFDRIFPLAENSAIKFGELKSLPVLRSQFPGDLDLLIASIALSNNESTVLTQNVRHFRNIPNLTVEQW